MLQAAGIAAALLLAAALFSVCSLPPVLCLYSGAYLLLLAGAVGTLALWLGRRVVPSWFWWLLLQMLESCGLLGLLILPVLADSFL